jgi:outer membrane receptor protein involved in Fe transport
MKTRIHTRRRALLAGAAAPVIALALWAGPAASQEEARSFAIAPQPLADALLQLSRQADIDIVAAAHLTRGRTAPQVSGDMPTAQAMAMLLAGSGLQAVPSTRGYVLARASDPQSGSAAGGGAEVEALIVTAQKREEDIQDVPIAISAFTQEDLTRSQVAGGPDLITQVPNMTFTKTNFSSYSIQLRGIGTQAISATTDPAVAVAFNNTPFIRNRFFEQEFYDLQRVEVLRGPQGTLYGRNATAGVVNIISQKPKFVAEAKLSGDVSNFNSSRLEGMVNIPLVEDIVALRVAGAWTKRDGYATNEISGDQIDGRDLWSTRLSLRIRPNDRFDMNLIWEHFQEDDDRLRSGKQLCKKDEVTLVGSRVINRSVDWVNVGNNIAFSTPSGILSQGCQRESLYSPDAFQTPNGLMLPYYSALGALNLPIALEDPYVSAFQSPDLRVIESTIDPIYRANNDLAELQIGWDITDTLSLYSETAYSTDFVYSLQDFNRFNTAPGAWQYLHNGQPTADVEMGILTPEGFYCDPQLGCQNRLVGIDISTAEGRQFSQEFRLASNFDGAFNFSLGANFLRSDSNDQYYVLFNSLSLMAVQFPVQEGWVEAYDPNHDNSDCLINGYAYGDPSFAYPIRGCIYIDPNPIPSINDQGHNYFLSNNPYKLISYAVFGEAYYNITDNLKVTAGLRWTVDKKEAPIVPTWVLNSNSAGYPVSNVIEQEWREPTGRLTVDWKPDLSFTDETLVYASLGHGYKAGGANPPGFVRSFYSDRRVALNNVEESATRPRTFDPEFIEAFEIGSKNTLLEGRATLNLAAFYYDYKDYQISEIVDRSAFNRNFDATVWGIELESDWRLLENLRVGIKGGYEKTRIADHEQAIDLMDRTAGDPAWTLVRPFPTYASSCIIPTFLFDRPTGLYNVGNAGGGGSGPCELAYQINVDPITNEPYDPDTLITDQGFTVENPYLGWDPDTAPNNGEGIMKPLGGNALPNAPNWTATITADYSIPLPNDWLVNLHTDLHWQSESYWRLFQDSEFSKLDEYFTMNLAAIFTNEERGWHVMAYIKNVTDETAITGAFLNSDDTGLTTNVFLTEPRLYGLRVTKTWEGGPLLGSFGERREGPYPFTLELGGQAQRHDAPNASLHPETADAFVAPFDIFDEAQANDLDWGDGREVKLTYRPAGSPWSIAGQVRFGKTNGSNDPVVQRNTDPICAFNVADYCTYFAQHEVYGPLTRVVGIESAFADVYDREEHTVVDFDIGYDVGLGGLSASTVQAGIRYARLKSTTDAELRGIPDWDIPEGFYHVGSPDPLPDPVTRVLYDITAHADREFSGFGPTLGWNAALPLLDLEGAGKVNVDWSVEGGVLFGERESTVTHEALERTANYAYFIFFDTIGSAVALPTPIKTVHPLVEIPRSESVTVPVFGGSLGLSYDVGAFKIGAGYRWERYFNAIDGGFEESKDEDRTIDGPYFKVSVGFGG